MSIALLLGKTSNLWKRKKRLSKKRVEAGIRSLLPVAAVVGILKGTWRDRTKVAYDKGRGVPQNYVLVHLWFNLGGAGGDKLAIKNRDLVAKRMTPSQIEKAQRLANEWKPKKRVFPIGTMKSK